MSRRNEMTAMSKKVIVIIMILEIFAGGCTLPNPQGGGLEKSDIKKLMVLQNKQVIPREEKVVEKLPPLTAADYEALGDQCLRQGDINRAFLQYDRALQLDKNNLNSRYKIAMIFLQKQLTNEAITEFEGIIKINNNYALAYEGLGLAAMQQKRYEDAEKFFIKALSLTPNLWRSHNFLGLTYSSRTDFDRAIDEYQKAVALKPDQGFLFNNLGLSYYFKGKYEEAIKAFNEALKTEPSNPKVYNNLAMALGRLGKYGEALEAFKKGGSEAEAYNNLGCLYLEEGKVDAAISAFEKAMASKSSFYAKANENLKRAQMLKQNQSPLPPPLPLSPPSTSQQQQQQQQQQLHHHLSDNSKENIRITEAATEVLPKEHIMMTSSNQYPEGRYAILTGSFRNQEKADELKGRLQRNEYPAYVCLIDLSGKGRWYRVMVGPYGDIQNTRKIASKLKSEVKVPVLILKDDKYH